MMKPILLLVEEREVLEYYNRHIERKFYEASYIENINDENMEMILKHHFDEVDDVFVYSSGVSFKTKGKSMSLDIELALKIGTKYFKLEEYYDTESFED